MSKSKDRNYTILADGRVILTGAVCLSCGKTYAATFYNRRSAVNSRLCPECEKNKKERSLASRRARDKARHTAEGEILKPRGMSEVRWRIEQRRRSDPNRYRDYGIAVR